MKNLLVTIGLILAVCATSFCAFYTICADTPPWRRAASEGDALAWLRTEFKLNDAQFAAIKRLHDDYGQVCADHCAAIVAAEKRGASTEERAALEQQCVATMTAHFRQVAAMMTAGEGERYLATVLPRVADYDHRGSPTVQGQH